MNELCKRTREGLLTVKRNGAPPADNDGGGKRAADPKVAAPGSVVDAAMPKEEAEGGDKEGWKSYCRERNKLWGEREERKRE